MKKKERQGYIMVLFFLMSLFVHAHINIKDPPLPKPDGGPGTPGEFPIDGGVSILLVLGTAFGIYKLKKKE